MQWEFDCSNPAGSDVYSRLEVVSMFIHNRSIRGLRHISLMVIICVSNSQRSWVITNNHRKGCISDITITTGGGMLNCGIVQMTRVGFPGNFLFYWHQYLPVRWALSWASYLGSYSLRLELLRSYSFNTASKTFMCPRSQSNRETNNQIYIRSRYKSER